MQTVETIGLDIAKSVFQVHRVDADGQMVIRRHSARSYHHSWRCHPSSGLRSSRCDGSRHSDHGESQPHSPRATGSQIGLRLFKRHEWRAAEKSYFAYPLHLRGDDCQSGIVITDSEFGLRFARPDQQRIQSELRIIALRSGFHR
jgi:hypothetical protein